MANDEILVYLIYYIQVTVVYCVRSLCIYMHIVHTVSSCRYEPSLHLTKDIYAPRKILRQIGAYGLRRLEDSVSTSTAMLRTLPRRAIYNIYMGQN